MAETIKWLEVTLESTAAGLDALTARLTANGVTGLVIEDEGDFQRFLEENRKYWDYVDEELLERMKGVCRVKLYVTDDGDGRAQLARWLEGIEAPCRTAPLGDGDWAYSWQKYYQPMPVGERLYIVPQWEREAPVPAGRTALYLNPASPSAPGATPPPSCAWGAWSGMSAPARPCWIWGAAAAFCPSPPWPWGRRRQWPWTSTPRPWT